MACSSNSIIQRQSSSSSSPSAITRSARNHKYYDVFVSFSGEDTRHGFTDNLFGALNRNGLVPFRDETMIRKGESLTPELHRAIEVSQVYIVVFSKIYPYSTWCMLELEYILKCVQPSGKRILPVFYDVDPSEVRKQSGDYAKAFVKYEERSKQDLEFQKVIIGWGKALTQVASISGWNVHNKLVIFSDIS